MEKIATDIYSFEKLRKNGFVYVDKSDLLLRLVTMRDGSPFFISRPRRFGKSLMLSTLHCAGRFRFSVRTALKSARPMR